MQVQSQITMAWNGSELLVEAANPESGAREKIAIGFLDLPMELQFVLRENLTKATARKQILDAFTKDVHEKRDLILAQRKEKIKTELQRQKEQRKRTRDLYLTAATTKGQGIEV